MYTVEVGTFGAFCCAAGRAKEVGGHLEVEEEGTRRKKRETRAKTKTQPDITKQEVKSEAYPVDCIY